MDAKDIAEELQETIVPDELESKDEEAPVPEKMLPASQVTELIKKAKLKGERKMQEQLDAAQQQIQQLQAQQQQQQAVAPQPQSPQAPQVDMEAMQQQIMQKLAQQQQEAVAKAHQEQIEKEVNDVAQKYFSKMAQGKDMFDDFEAITADFDPAAFPQLVYLATEAENTPAIIYELRKNPAKLAQLSLLVDKSPQMARNEIAKLSQSIKTNDDAKRGLQESPDPLNRLKPSQAGTDNGIKTIRDYKTSPNLRG